MSKNMLKYKWIAALLCFLSMGYSEGIYAQKSSKVQARVSYINTYKDVAISQMQKYGIPASITLAQGCLESGDGRSTLAVKANNHFGIKCHSDWKGPTVRHDDDAKNECFRKYKTPVDSYVDHSKFLKSGKRYASLFYLPKTDYKKWAFGLKSAGYATNPNYAHELIKIIEDYNLYKYDNGKYAVALDFEGMSQETVAIAEYDMDIEGLADGLSPLKSSPLYALSADRPLYSKDGRVFVFANDGESLKSIAKEYNLFNGQIKRFNKALKGRTLRAGDVVYLEK